MSAQDDKEPEGMATDAPVWVNIGEFRVLGIGQLRAYLAEDPDQPGKPDRNTDSVRFDIVHPVTELGIAVVTGVETEEPAWTTVPDAWSITARKTVVSKALLLKHVGEVS